MRNLSSTSLTNPSPTPPAPPNLCEEQCTKSPPQIPPPKFLKAITLFLALLPSFSFLLSLLHVAHLTYLTIINPNLESMAIAQRRVLQALSLAILTSSLILLMVYSGPHLLRPFLHNRSFIPPDTVSDFQHTLVDDWDFSRLAFVTYVKDASMVLLTHFSACYVTWLIKIDP